MKNFRYAAAASAAAFVALSAVALADDDHRGPLPRNATFTTLAITPLAIEGLTADDEGNLYTTGRDLVNDTCPVWKFTGVTRTTVGFIPNPAAARWRRSGNSRRTRRRLPSAWPSPRAFRERTASRSTATATSGLGMASPA